jgi:hypothetical protein
MYKKDKRKLRERNFIIKIKMKKKDEAYHTMEEESKNEEVINEPYFTCLKSTMAEKQFKEFLKLVEQALELSVYLSFRHIFRKYFNTSGEIPIWLKRFDNCCCELLQQLFRNHKFDKIIELLKQDIKIYIEEQLKNHIEPPNPPNTPEHRDIELQEIKPEKDKFLVIDSYLSQSF